MKRIPTRLVARNMHTGELVANRVTVATKKVDRAIGLLKHSNLEPGEGLLITPCRGVHTCGMRFTIDIVALDETGLVVDAVQELAPWRIRLPRPGAVSVLELPAGSLSRTHTERGHRIELQLEPAWGVQ